MKRALRILVRVVVILAVTLVLAILFRRPLFGGLLANVIAQQISEATGGNFTLDGVGGGWLSDIVLLGLRGETRNASVAVQQIELAYSLRDLLGDRPQDAIASLNVVDARIDLDLAQPAAPGPPGEPFDWSLLPASLPRINVTGSLAVKTGDGELKAGVLRVDGSGRALDVALDDLDIPGFERLPLVTGRLELGDRTWTLDATAAVAQGSISVRAEPGSVKGDVEDIEVGRFRSDLSGRASGSFEAASGAVRAGVTITGLRHAELRADKVAFHGAYQDGRVRIDSLEALSGKATVRATEVVVDPDSPYGVASVARLDVDVPDLRAYLPELPMPLRVSARAASDDGRNVRIAEARVAGAGTDLSLEGTAALDPDDWRRSVLHLSVRGVVGDLNAFAADLPVIEGSVHVRGEVSGSWEDPRADLRADGADLVVEGRRVSEVRLDAVVARSRMVVRSLRLLADPGRVEAYGEVDLEERRLKDGAFTLEIGDLAGFAALFPGAPAVSGTLSGAGKLEGEVARLSLKGRDLAYESVAVGSVTLAADMRAGLLDVSQAHVEGEWGNAALRGVVEPGEKSARIDLLAASYRGRTVNLLVPAKITWDDAGIRLLGLDLDALGGRVTGRAAWADRLDAVLSGDGVDLAEVWPELKGRAGFQLVVSGPAARIDLGSESLVYEGHRGRLVLKAVQDGDGLFVEQLLVDSGTALQVRAHGRLPWRFGPDGAERVDGVDPSLVLEAAIDDLKRFSAFEGRATASVEGDGKGLRADLLLRDLLPPDGPRLDGESRLRVDVTRESTSFSVVTQKSERGYVTGVLRADRGADWTHPAQLRSALAEGRVEGALDLTLPTLDLLKPFLPERIRVSGAGRGKLVVRGEVRRPEIDGSVELDGLRCSFGPGFPAFREGRGRALFHGHTLRIEDCSGEVGHAPVSFGGSVTLPDEGLLEVDLTLRGENVLLMRDQFLRLRADLDLALRGPLDSLSATGKVHITDALYTRPANLLARGTSAADRSLRLFSIREGPLSSMRFDIGVTGKESIRWKNNLFRGAVSLDLALKGTGEVPEPQGRIFFRDVLVQLPLTSLKVDQGEVRFPQENPFVPEAEVAAHTRMQGYDLDVRITGAMPDFSVFVTTTPPMSQDEAVVLLTTGATPEELERKGLAASAATRAASYFGRTLVAKYGGPSDPDEQSLLDRFEFRVGSDVSRTGAETVEAEFEVNRRWFLRAERDRFDEVNFGVVWRLRFR